MSHTAGIVFLGCSRISELRGWAGAQAHSDPAPADCGCPTASTPYHEHAEGPPVCTLRVAPPVHHLGRHVLDRPAEGVGPLVMVDGLFAQPEIYRDTQDTVLRPLAARPALPSPPSWGHAARRG